MYVCMYLSIYLSIYYLSMFLAPYADESATMTQSAQATISPNRHKAYILHKIMYKYMYMHLCNLYNWFLFAVNYI